MIQEANGSPESKQHYQKLARYTEVNATLKNIFFTWILVFDELLVEIDNVLQKECLRLPCQQNTNVC